MMFPLTIMLALRTVVATATMDESAVVSTLRQIEINALLVRDEVESAYSSRCDPDTLNQCEGQNWNACSLTFTSPYCVNPSDHGYSSNCSCGCECGCFTYLSSHILHKHTHNNMLSCLNEQCYGIRPFLEYLFQPGLKGEVVTITTTTPPSAIAV